MAECYFGFSISENGNRYGGQNIAAKIREIRQVLERDGLTGPDMGSRPPICFSYSDEKIRNFKLRQGIAVNEMFELPDEDFGSLWCSGFDAEGRSCRGCPYVSEAIGKKQPAIEASEQHSTPE